MESPKKESQEPQADDSKELAELKIEDNDESEMCKQIEQLKAIDDSEEELIQNKADDMPGSYPYVMFDEDYDKDYDEDFDKILNDFESSNQSKELPALFSEESEENYDDGSNVECDEGNTSENAGHIDKNTKTICEMVLYGFQLAVTEGILKTGNIDLERFRYMPSAKKMTHELDENCQLWKEKNTTEAILLGNVHQILEAIVKPSYTEIAKTYYRAQHQHTLNAVDQPLKIPVHIDHTKINKKWLDHLKNAIDSINMATPGILLKETENFKESKIRIGVEDTITHDGKKVNTTKMAYTRNGGSFLNAQKNQSTKMPFIHLGGEWNETKMKGTSIHELMHALSFHHEMQRPDTDKYMELSKAAKLKMKKRNHLFLTRFDPFSVMMYTLGIDIKKKEGDDIWNLKSSSERCQELSELNKVALNLTFKPCVTDGYKPTINNKTKMLYCGRAVMINHNQVGKATSNYNCGPNNWANCPACRVIIRKVDEQQKSFLIPQLETCLKLDKWQGLSGVFYCGKEDEAFNECKKYPKKNNICGPDNGIPCKDCGERLYKNYSMKVWAKLF